MAYAESWVFVCEEMTARLLSAKLLSRPGDGAFRSLSVSCFRIGVEVRFS
jgi:hypothetical protein